MAVNLLANLEGVSGSVHPTDLDHRESAHKRQRNEAAGSVGIPPAAPDKARGQARPAQSICGRPQHGNVLVPLY